MSYRICTCGQKRVVRIEQSESLGESSAINASQRRPARCKQSNNSLNIRESSTRRKSLLDNTSKHRQRASSAGGNEKTSSRTSKKVASSDSKLTHTIENAKTQKLLKNLHCTPNSSDSSESVHLQLRDDLKVIKDQLKILTDNKNEALCITNELHERYKLLMSKNEQQGREIERLKGEKQIDIGNRSPAIELKMNLDEYEQKLEVLYSEFLDSSKAMEETREKVCRCIKEKSNDRNDEIADLREKLDAALSEKNIFQLECKELTKTTEILQNRLNEALEKTQKVELAENNLKQQILTYAKKLEEKSIIMGEMSATVDELKQHVCECRRKTDQVDSLQEKYHNLQVEHNKLIKKFKQNEANDVRRYNQNVQLMKTMQERERELVEEQQKLRKVVSQLTAGVRENEGTIEKLECMCEEKDFIIQSQLNELEDKTKQVTLVSNSFQRNYRKCEESASNQNQICAGSTPRLSQELEELISALYSEIETSLAKEQIIRDQFVNICELQRALVSKQQEVGCTRCELLSIKKKLMASMKQNGLLLEELKHLELQNNNIHQDMVLECYSEYEDKARCECPMNCE